MPLLLEKNKPYLVQVNKVEPKRSRPSFVKNNETWYNFLIEIQLKDGNTGTVEYASKRDVCEVFEIGVWQNIICIQPSDKGCQVEPYDPEANKQPVIPPAERYNDIKPTDTKAPSQYSVRVNGEAIVFCMAWAKDLKVAEIAQRPEGYGVSQEDLEEIATWADFFCNKMIDRLKF
jgi:hypothetical protein